LFQSTNRRFNLRIKKAKNIVKLRVTKPNDDVKNATKPYKK
jgi:hypothetical protein